MPAAVRQDAPQTCNEIEYITENNGQEIDYVKKKNDEELSQGNHLTARMKPVSHLFHIQSTPDNSNPR